MVVVDAGLACIIWSRLCHLRTASLSDLGWDWRYQTHNRGLSYSWPWSRLAHSGWVYWTVSIAGRRAWRKGIGPRPCLLRASGFEHFMWGYRIMSFVKRSRLTAEWSERWPMRANVGSYGCVFGIAQLDVIDSNHHLSQLMRNLIIVR